MFACAAAAPDNQDENVSSSASSEKSSVLLGPALVFDTENSETTCQAAGSRTPDKTASSSSSSEPEDENTSCDNDRCGIISTTLRALNRLNDMFYEDVSALNRFGRDMDGALTAVGECFQNDDESTLRLDKDQTLERKKKGKHSLTRSDGSLEYSRKFPYKDEGYLDTASSEFMLKVVDVQSELSSSSHVESSIVHNKNDRLVSRRGRSASPQQCVSSSKRNRASRTRPPRQEADMDINRPTRPTRQDRSTSPQKQQQQKQQQAKNQRTSRAARAVPIAEYPRVKGYARFGDLLTETGRLRDWKPRNAGHITPQPYAINKKDVVRKEKIDVEKENLRRFHKSEIIEL